MPLPEIIPLALEVTWRMPAAQHVCFAQQQMGLAKGMRDQGEAVLELPHPRKRLMVT